MAEAPNNEQKMKLYNDWQRTIGLPVPTQDMKQMIKLKSQIKIKNLFINNKANKKDVKDDTEESARQKLLRDAQRKLNLINVGLKEGRRYCVLSTIMAAQ